MKSVTLNSHDEQVVNVLQALGDETRFKMFKIMRSGREMCVSEIANELGITSPAVSQHFRIFELNGLVDRERYGQKICYKLKADNTLIKKLNNII